ncbi:hypothetical protein PRIPAC_74088 [Pristionchus pacificus]|uniref:Zinc finger CCCH domain-containing protein 14 n=1 Tax=Pristionchus pacificus TaxID=54126 RepID=A0A2A6CRN0_PRIPA|nr:hypothetical protein PRIPAC_74088 [Pristionchus pacificus]|eukprot:PDM80799.1 hypothetical protein PRIPAC_35802 [Pristionchus pacificus]
MASADQKSEYLLWLKKLKLRDGFMDSSCYAAVSLCLKSLFKRDTFRLPYFILDEELRKEQNNVLEMTSKLTRNENCPYVSPVIRHLLVVTLQLCEPQKRVNSSNYMSHLRSFLTRPRVLPLNISNPITSSFISFHCLPTECKLYILNMLFHQTPKVLDTCTHLGNDSVGNKFYLAQDARVYAAMKNDPETNLFEEYDGKTILHEAWGDLYKFIKTEMPRWKLVAENEQDWDVMEVKLTSLDERELWARMKSHKKAALSARNSSVNEKTRTKERNALAAVISRLSESEDMERRKDKIPDDPSPERAKKLQSKIERLEKELRSLKTGNTSTDTTNSSRKGIKKKNDLFDTRRVRVIKVKKDPAPEPFRGQNMDRKNDWTSEESEESTIELSNKRQERCRFWPKCRESDEDCIYIHPRTKCTRFPYCPYGSACLFLHGTCRNDGVCTRESCPYEHTLRRSVRAPPCKYGAQCYGTNCSYAHPAECTRRACPGPTGCSFYHPPVSKKTCIKSRK